MFCVKCGAQLDDNAIFCPKCGNKVGEVSATASASPEVIVKSKRECIYDAVCRFLRATPQYLTGATFSDFEVYAFDPETVVHEFLCDPFGINDFLHHSIFSSLLCIWACSAFVSHTRFSLVLSLIPCLKFL